MQGVSPRVSVSRVNLGRFVSIGESKIDKKALAEFQELKIKEGAAAIRTYVKENMSPTNSKEQLVSDFCKVYRQVLDEELASKFGKVDIDISAILPGIRVGLLTKIRESV